MVSVMLRSVRRTVEVLQRNVWIGGASAAVFLAIWFKFWSPVGVEAVRVDRGSVVQEAYGRGTIESQREVAAGFDLVGRLSEVLVEEGARVALGQELARIETEQAQADLHAAQSGVNAARSALQRLAVDEERARAALLAAERDATRTQALHDAGAVPRQQRDDASDRRRIARAELDRVLAQRSEAMRSIDVARGSAEQRRIAMVRATLLAPFDGLVTRRLREPGDLVTVGTTVLRIADTERVFVNAAMDETVLPRLSEDQSSLIFFPGSTEPIAGHVTRVSWEADRQTHEILVEVTPVRLERRVAIGQRADVRIEVERRDNVVRVPSHMIHRDDNGPFIYVDRGGRVAVVRLELGLVGNNQVEVAAGLREGDIALAATGAAGALPLGRRWRTQ